ncbi:MAG: dolichol-phosphate mannosyltransferase [Hyphomicrobiales bacterium]|nr:dolichol-phosphate mannosyltransferase [Hyphomicrobiales bacterium]
MNELPSVSVVVPVRNEAGNIEALVTEIEAALSKSGAFEIVYVNDGSTDGTSGELARLSVSRPHLREILHEASCGQSAAVRSGVRAAHGSIILTLDGDGQNDPSFMPAFLTALRAAGPGCGLVQGQRVGRKDTGFKRMQSRIANKVRAAVLNDGTRDTGCGFKCFPREAYLALPYFDALHRFMPALIRREGLSIAYVDVVDRPRLTGVSNYGFFDRLWVGIVDLAGVRWLLTRRKRVPVATEVVR